MSVQVNIIFMFHRNNSCIETTYLIFPKGRSPMFHRNNSCIETRLLLLKNIPLPGFHRNNSCIETLINEKNSLREECSTETIVVLKHNLRTKVIYYKLCSTETIVVLKQTGK